MSSHTVSPLIFSHYARNWEEGELDKGSHERMIPFTSFDFTAEANESIESGFRPDDCITLASMNETKHATTQLRGNRSNAALKIIITIALDSTYCEVPTDDRTIY